MSPEVEEEVEEWPNTLWDEVTDKLFGELNPDLLGLMGDKILIIISDSEEDAGDESAPTTIF
jgi:hypothetical protein